MATAQTPIERPERDATEVRRHATAKLTNFDEEALRNSLIQAAGNELLMVAESSGHSMREQSEAIRRSASAVDDIFRRMNQVVDRVQEIDAAVDSVQSGAHDSAQQLQEVHAKVQGVADEFRRLSDTAQNANGEIRDTLARVGRAIDELSQTMDRSVQSVHRSLETITTAKQNASHVETEAIRFHQQFHGFRECLGQLAGFSARVESEIQEVNTISSTFGYLLEMMTMQGVFQQALDPLARLFPLVRASSFYDPHRFAADEDEYVLTDQDVVISATDPTGIITFANDRFYEISEYAPGELIGQSHNVIRHPDMPKTTFADLWTVIQKGKTWQGYVKNRSKTGRVYWLKASVFPCFEEGRIVGYISIRTRPDRNKVRQATEVYRRLP